MINRNEVLVAPKNIGQGLDSQQLTAVQAPIGNTCLYAVAGSGKTTALTRRVANLIDHGVSDESIMLLTFTNQAAKEMTTRIKEILNKESVNITSGTFHSIANAFLRKYDKERHIILDSDDTINLVSRLRKEYIKEKGIAANSFPQAGRIYGLFSKAVNHNEELSEVLKNSEVQEIYQQRYHILELNKRFKEAKAEIPARDFDDLMVDGLRLLQNNHEAREDVTNSFKHIFVDEYQDINWWQHEFLKIINDNQSLFVVGDRAQCIYQFRGSDDTYMDSFIDDYGEKGIEYFLQNNYRSRPAILNVAEKSINNNNYKQGVILNAQKADNGTRVSNKSYRNQYDEAKGIINDIKSNHYRNLEEVAILLRTNFQTKLFEQQCVKNKLPYRVLSGISFFSRTHIKDILAVLTFAVHPKNPITTTRILTLFEGIGEIGAMGLFNKMENYNFDVQKLIDSNEVKSLTQLFGLETLASIQTKSDTDSIVQDFLDNFYESYLKLNFDTFEERLIDIELLISEAHESTIEEFLDTCVLDTELDEDDESDGEKITIMTMHKSKGREWDVIYVPSLIHGVFPSRVSNLDLKNNTKDVQNERNLFYVAMTRAKEQLNISHYTSKSVPNRGRGGWYNEPAIKSGFIDELIKK